MSPEREREYAELDAYLDFYATNVWGIERTDPVHPTNVGKRIVAEYGKSAALDGLKQAVNDTVEDLRDQPPDFINELDSALRKKGLLTFSEVRRRYASSYRRILKRGEIRNEYEYYLIAGVLADATSSADQEERDTLEKLINRFQSDTAGRR